MRGFLGNVLKTNEFLDFAVLTGVTRISKESIFSGLNNLSVCSVVSERYSDIFGFTEAEAAKLMADCGVAEKLPELQKWYDGYLIRAASCSQLLSGMRLKILLSQAVRRNTFFRIFDRK